MAFKNMQDLRFYLYRSKRKVDMLYEQLRRDDQSRLKKSVRGNFGVISGSVESDSEKKVDDEDKLRVVEAELHERGLVGSVESPNEYFKGTILMRWGLYDDAGQRPDGEAPLVFFGGFVKTTATVVGLGGSSQHVEGHSGASATYSRSNTTALVRWMQAGTEGKSAPELPPWWDQEGERSEVLGAVAMAVYYLNRPTQAMEFLAKTLMTGTLHGYEHFTGVAETQIILGTPLYVAQAHPLPDEDRRPTLNESW